MSWKIRTQTEMIFRSNDRAKKVPGQFDTKSLNSLRTIFLIIVISHYAHYQLLLPSTQKCLLSDLPTLTVGERTLYTKSAHNFI